MASKKYQPSSPRLSVRRQVSKRKEDRRRHRIAVALIAVFVLAIGAVIAYGYFTTFVLPPRRLVVRVNDATYTLGDMVNLIRVSQKTAEFNGQKVDLTQLPFTLIADLMNNELIVQAAPRYGLSDVSDEEIQQQLHIFQI